MDLEFGVLSLFAATQANWRSTCLLVWGETLLHTLWQGLVVVGLVSSLLGTPWLRSASRRYHCCLLGLGALTLAPMVTSALVLSKYVPPSTSETPPVTSAGTEQVTALVALRAQRRPAANPAAEFQDRPQARHQFRAIIPAWLQRGATLRVVAQCWCIGALLVSLRFVLAYWHIARLRRTAQPIPPNRLRVTVPIARRIGLKTIPLVYASEQVTDAFAMGWFRPVVLVPLVWVTQFPLPVWEAVIAHEFSHIRRYDLWINAWQRGLEVLYFFHPAIWWLSRRTSEERELVCDRVAAAACQQRQDYVRALEAIARFRLEQTGNAWSTPMSERRMLLLVRVRALLDPVAQASPVGWWPAALLALVVPWVAVVSDTGASELSTNLATSPASRQSDLSHPDEYEVKACDTRGKTQSRWLRVADFPTLVDAIVQIGGLPAESKSMLRVRRHDHAAAVQSEAIADWNWISRAPQSPANFALSAGDCILLEVPTITPTLLTPQETLNQHRDLEVLIHWFNQCVLENRYDAAELVRKRIRTHYPQHPANRVLVDLGKQISARTTYDQGFTCVYPVSDLLDCDVMIQVDARGTISPVSAKEESRAAAFERIEQRLTTQIAPETWGRQARVSRFDANSSLVILQNEEVHRAIAEEFARMRDGIALLRTQWLRLPPAILEPLSLDGKPCASINNVERQELVIAGREHPSGKVHLPHDCPVYLGAPFGIQLSDRPGWEIRFVPVENGSPQWQLCRKDLASIVTPSNDGATLFVLPRADTEADRIDVLLLDLIPRHRDPISE